MGLAAEIHHFGRSECGPYGCGPSGGGPWAPSQGAEVAVGGKGGEGGQGDAQGVSHAGSSHGELPLPVS